MVYRTVEMKTFTYLQYITLNIDLYCRVFIDERKTQQNRQERRREKVKKTHESQMSELKRYVQNVRTISLTLDTIIWSYCYHQYINLIYNSTLNSISVDWYVQKWRNRVQTSCKRRMFCVSKLSKLINRLHTSNYELLLLVIWNVFRDKI